MHANKPVPVFAGLVYFWAAFFAALLETMVFHHEIFSYFLITEIVFVALGICKKDCAL